MKYTGTWSANNKSSYGDGYESNNKKELEKDLKEILAGNITLGSSGHWNIYRDNGYFDRPLSSGTVRISNSGKVSFVRRED